MFIYIINCVAGSAGRAAGVRAARVRAPRARAARVPSHLPHHRHGDCCKQLILYLKHVDDLSGVACSIPAAGQKCYII